MFYTTTVRYVQDGTTEEWADGKQSGALGRIAELVQDLEDEGAKNVHVLSGSQVGGSYLTIWGDCTRLVDVEMHALIGDMNFLESVGRHAAVTS